MKIRFLLGTLFLGVALLPVATATAKNVNDKGTSPPVITEGDVVAVTMSEDGTPTAFALTLNATDDGADPLTWSVASPASNGTAAIVGADTSATVNFTPTANFNGTDSFGIQVADTEGGTDLILVNVTVSAESDPPAITPIGNQTTGENEALIFVVEAIDPDGDVAVLGVANAPEGAAFNGETGVFSWTPGFDEAGVYSEIVFTAIDGSDDTVSVSETIAITVNDTNRAPELATVSNREIREESTLTITLSATDADGNGLTFFMEMLPEGAVFNAGTATLTYTPALGTTGDYAVLAGVRDNGNPVQQDTQAFVITVTERDLGAELEAIAEALIAGIEAADSDENGALTFAEATTILPDLQESRFETLDSNQDGELSRLELLNRALVTETALENAANTLLNGFAGADANEDMLLSENEARTIQSTLPTDRFVAMDGDADGFLSELEISTVATARAVRQETLAEGLLAILDEADTDEDGQLSRLELEATDLANELGDFEDLDLNLDGLLTEAEITTAALAGDADLEAAGELIFQFFYEADQDRDGLVSREEAVRGIDTLTLRDFMELDSDGDGFLSREEVREAGEQGDAALETAAEALANNFADGDLDADGVLTREEAEALFPGLTLEQFQELDSNGNGEISEEEADTAASFEDPVPLAPVIVEGVTIGGLTETSALVRWKTQVDSVAEVRYGTSADALSMMTTSTVPGGEHQIAISDLTADTLYFVQVDSFYPGDNSLASTSRIFSFQTRNSADVVAPAFVAAPIVAGTSDTAVILAWETNEITFGEVTVSSGDSDRAVEADFAAQRQAVIVSDLTPGTPYDFLVSVRDASGNLTTAMLSMTTLSTPSRAPARFVDGPLITRLSNTSIGLRWLTDIPSTTEVSFTPNGGTAIGQSLPGLRREHFITLVGLTPETTYTIEVEAEDWLGNAMTIGAGPTTTTLEDPLTDAPLFLKAPEVINVTDTMAIIRWETKYPSDSTVTYGIPTGQTFTAASSAQVLRHQLTLTDLRPGSQYQFSATSTDLDGRSHTATSNAEPGTTNNALLGFRTADTPDVTPPVITEGPEVVGVTEEGFTVVWTTNEVADSYVRYGLVDTVERLEIQDNTLSTDHVVTIRGLSVSQDYELAVNSADASGNGPVSAVPLTVTTAATADTTGPAFRTGPTVSSIASTTALLSWSTNELSSGEVTLNVTQIDIGSIQSVPVLDTAQSLVLTGLTPNTPYAVTVRATDQSLNETVSAAIPFTTASAEITVTPTRVILAVDSTASLSVSSEDPNETRFLFASENDAIASVTNTGLITANAVGTTNVFVADTLGERIVTVPVAVFARDTATDLTGFFSLLGIFLLQNGESGVIGPCFIATAASGTPLSPEIGVLRQFRDEWLLSNGPGTMFVDVYYQVSPPLADWIAVHPRMAVVVRLLLLPVILLAGCWMYSPTLTLAMAGLLIWAASASGARPLRLRDAPNLPQATSTPTGVGVFLWAGNDLLNSGPIIR